MVKGPPTIFTQMGWFALRSSHNDIGRNLMANDSTHDSTHDRTHDGTHDRTHDRTRAEADHSRVKEGQVDTIVYND